MAREAQTEAQAHVQDMAACRSAMIQLAKQYDRKLQYWESRVSHCYTQLREADNVNAMELLGTTLDELRLVQSGVQSDAARLREQGLRLVPADHVLTAGDFVVIVGSSAWEGAEGTVVSMDGNQVCVSVSTSPLEEDKPQLITLARHEIAIWDYDSVFDDNSNKYDWSGGTSREESQRRLNGILSSMQSTNTPTTTKSSTNDKDNKPTSFTSSRQRRAAKKRKANK